MKNNILSFLVITFILVQCTTDENRPITENSTARLKLQTHTQFTTAQLKWQTERLPENFILTQAAVSHYSFDSRALHELIAIKEVDMFWFTLGLNNKAQIIIDAIGVNTKKEVVGTVKSTIVQKSNFDDQQELAALKKSYSYDYKLKENPIVEKHIIRYQEGDAYITRWESALQEKGLEEIVSYEDQRYRQFGMEAETITHMIEAKNVDAIALFLGVNPDQELTTVFIKKNKYNSLLLTRETSRNTTDDGVYDVTTPRPPFSNEQ